MTPELTIKSALIEHFIQKSRDNGLASTHVRSVTARGHCATRSRHARSLSQWVLKHCVCASCGQWNEELEFGGIDEQIGERLLHQTEQEASQLRQHAETSVASDHRDEEVEFNVWRGHETDLHARVHFWRESEVPLHVASVQMCQ